MLSSELVILILSALYPDGVISHIAAQTFDVDIELTYIINVTVTDGTHEVSDQVTITVMNTHNDKPIFSNLPDTAGVREDRFPGWTIYTVTYCCVYSFKKMLVPCTLFISFKKLLNTHLFKFIS